MSRYEARRFGENLHWYVYDTLKGAVVWVSPHRHVAEELCEDLNAVHGKSVGHGAGRPLSVAFGEARRVAKDLERRARRFERGAAEDIEVDSAAETLEFAAEDRSGAQAIREIIAALGG